MARFLRDAAHLARLLRMDQITAVRVPAADEEAARDLVRAREDVRSDLMRSRHRVWQIAAAAGNRVVRRDGLDRCA